MKVLAALVGLAIADKHEPKECNFGDDAVVCADATTCCSKATGVDLSGVVGKKLGDATVTEENQEEMEKEMLKYLKKEAEKGEGSCLPLAESTFTKDGTVFTYECGDDRLQTLDEALNDLTDGIDAAGNCVADNLLDPEAAEECLKWAGKDCADEAVVEAADKDACEAAQASAKALFAGAIALIATAALM